jgi:hypothetical protein
MKTEVNLTGEKVEFCKGDACFRAEGKNARVLAAGGLILLTCLGIAMIVKASRG